ncbi:hypothetical protein AVEN_199505-1 [Araneus ventricosus]|uniref:Uncharacterized protein n=1 Tax=Araneus ventricosus TaxID=182803 RepID=A0A4Y2UVS4_ARAVE|nr:hypothetical protein AVEN_62576-1 [Araneus ventricosus]GBO15796.1 hypothetical protein AVEN_199505-1 [Araneus ventricosus]
MEIYVALLCVAVVLWLAWRWKKLSLWQNLGIQGPKPNLIFGNIIELYRKASRAELPHTSQEASVTAFTYLLTASV